jgi:hypothetical protein
VWIQRTLGEFDCIVEFYVDSGHRTEPVKPKEMETEAGDAEAGETKEGEV